MARTSSQWRYWFRLVQTLPLAELAESVQRFPYTRRSRSRKWLLTAISVAALLCWNDRLVLATGAGVGVMLFIPYLKDWQPQWSAAKWHRWLDGWDQPLTLAALGGGVATLTTYLAATIWAESESPWIATGALIQGAGTVAVLLLLSWQILHRQRGQAGVDPLLAELSHEQPLRRLRAIRQITQTLPTRLNDHPWRRQVGDSFCLLLNHEPEPIVRDALLAGLQQLNQGRSLKQAAQMEFAPPRRGQSALRQRIPTR